MRVVAFACILRLPVIESLRIAHGLLASLQVEFHKNQGSRVPVGDDARGISPRARKWLHSTVRFERIHFVRRRSGAGHEPMLPSDCRRYLDLKNDRQFNRHRSVRVPDPGTAGHRVSNRPVNSEYFHLILEVSNTMLAAAPGQFFHLRCPRQGDDSPCYAGP